MKMETVIVQANELGQAYNNYCKYVKKLDPTEAPITTYIAFEKLIDLHDNLISTSDGARTWSSQTAYFVLKEPCAHLVRLLASDHYHAIIKAKLATKKPALIKPVSKKQQALILKQIAKEMSHD
jgi:hypothetical protein